MSEVHPRIKLRQGIPRRERLFCPEFEYARSFVGRHLREVEVEPGSVLLDPWVGTGTVLRQGMSSGLETVAFDQNPVMVIVSRARLLQRDIRKRIRPMAKQLVEAAGDQDGVEDDALEQWFRPEGARHWRAIAKAILAGVEGEESTDLDLTNPKNVSGLSPLTCFYFVGLFRAVRQHLSPFMEPRYPPGRRPHRWIWPAVLHDRRRLRKPSWEHVSRTFLEEIQAMRDVIYRETLYSCEGIMPRVSAGDARSLPMDAASVDHIVTCLPRFHPALEFDNAALCRSDLAVLGYPNDKPFHDLRRKLVGTIRCGHRPRKRDGAWGPVCAEFIDFVATYRKSAYSEPSERHRDYVVKYFLDMEASFRELRRVLRPGASMLLVVKERWYEFYEEIYVDLLPILNELAAAHSLSYRDEQPYGAVRLLRPRRSGAVDDEGPANGGGIALEFVAT